MATLNRKGQGASPGTAAMIIILIMAVTIIFYVMTVTPEAREALIGKVQVPGVPAEISRTVLDVSPGLIQGIPESQLTRYAHNLVTFTVDNTPQPQTKALATQFLVKRSLTTDMPAEMNFVISDKTNLASVNLEMLVNDRKEKGELIVVMNDKPVFAATVDAGQKLVVALPVDSISAGNNIIKIYAAGPGMKFWAINSYLLSDINLVTYTYSGEKAGQTQTIALSKDELSGIRSAKLTAFVKRVSDGAAPIAVKLNGAEIYSATPKTDSLSIEIPASKVQAVNTLQWFVGVGSEYTIEFGKFTVLTAPTGGNVKSYSFSLTQDEYSAAATGKIDCKLELSKTVTATTTSEEDNLPPPLPTGAAVAQINTVDVNINGNVNTYSFTDDTITEDVCSYMKSGTNTLQLSATEDVTVAQMKLTLKSK